MVFDALAMPLLMASSKLFGDSQLISMILATDMGVLLSSWRAAGIGCRDGMTCSRSKLQ
jgi:hypothetical protein